MPDLHRHIFLKDGCFAKLAEDGKTHRCVIFVHGWGGSPEATWFRFQELVDDQSDQSLFGWWRETDLYFYSYESRRFSISEHTERFLRFLDQVYPKRLTSLVSGNELEEHTYTELVLVGHSLGAVVLREGVLDRAAVALAPQRASAQSAAILDAQLRLFAPAMHGAKPSGFLGLAYHLLREIREIKPWIEAAAESQTIVRQLKSESDKLTRLRTDTEELAAKTSFRALVADVVYGEKEHIVERDKFRLDRINLPLAKRDHRSVCKPDTDYREPLKFVKEGAHA
jgi:pimeloyl-ACP methyl ester carboxylesterase